MGHSTCGFHMTYIFSPILHLTRVSLSGKIHLVSLIFLSRGSGDCVMVSEGGVRHIWPQHLQTAASVQSAGDWLWQTFKQYTTKYSGLQHYQKMS